MNDLIVVGYPDEQRAYDVWAELVKLRHDYLVDLEDAAIIWRDENGKVHVTTPAHHAVAKGTVSGLFWGLTPFAVMVDESPGLMVSGLAEQPTVGGSYAFTVNTALQLAASQGFSPSLPFLPSFTWPCTV